jgi:hypothetical protein
MSTHKTFRVVCMVCKSPKDGLGPITATDTLSHGICHECCKKKYPEYFSEDNDYEQGSNLAR